MFVAYAYRFVVAHLVALPIATVFGSAVGGYPRRDAVLFDEGGLLFIETLRRSGTALQPLMTGAFALLVVASFAGIMPLAALIGALGTKGRIRAGDLGAFALRPVGTFALLFGAFALVQAIVAGIVMGIGGAISGRSAFDAPTSDGVKVVFALVALLLVLLIGVVHDLARVASVRDDLGFRASLRRAWTTIKRSHLVVLGAWVLPATLALVLIYAAMSIVSRLGVDSGAKVFFGFLVYQASVYGALFLRATWLGSAIRHVDRSRPSPELPEVVMQEAPVADPAPAPTEPAVPDEAPLPPENPQNEAALPPEAPGGGTENSDSVLNREAGA